jgi:hypothetical protein
VLVSAAWSQPLTRQPQDQLGVFAESSLEVIYTRKTRLELRAALYKPVCPLLANATRATRCKEEICHIFNTTNPGWKPSRIQVEYVSHKGLFLR